MNDVGLKVLAACHAGYLTINCSECEDNDKANLYCSGVSDNPIYKLDDEEFYSCPIKFINIRISQWFDEYNYYQTFPGTAPTYNKCSAIFWEMTKLYRYYLNHFEEKMREKQEEVQKEKKTKDAFNKLRMSRGR
jgi:hypothetical protein